jgi:hypothetical protein
MPVIVGFCPDVDDHQVDIFDATDELFSDHNGLPGDPAVGREACRNSWRGDMPPM